MTVTDDDALLDDDAPESEALLSRPVEPIRAASAVAWKVLVVDDDADVLLMSRLALRGLVLEGEGVALVCVASAAEARAYLTTPDADVAVVLLDVVMEDDTAGLDLAHWIRAQVTDRSLRIVLRTGQPGSAPESSVMNAYDIHDYLAKADTTARRSRVQRPPAFGFAARLIAATLAGSAGPPIAAVHAHITHESASPTPRPLVAVEP